MQHCNKTIAFSIIFFTQKGFGGVNLISSKTYLGTSRNCLSYQRGADLLVLSHKKRRQYFVY